MKKLFSAFAFAVLMSGQVLAWEFDMAEVTCEDMDSEETAAMTLFWLDGYVSAKEDDTVISSEWVDELASYLEEGCEEDTSQSVLDIVHDKYLGD